MTSASTPDATPASAPASLSFPQRLVAIYARPTEAWAGLRERAQWWLPLIIALVVTTAGTVALHERAYLPMLTAQWDEAVADGQMPAAQADQMEAFFAGPAGLAFLVGQQVVAFPLITLVMALLVWFGVGFALGVPMRFRWAFEVTCWAWLVSLPGTLLTYALAWVKESFEGVRIGFGLLVPEPETPNRLLTGLATFLDGLGPFQIWWLVVVILGAAALSGAPRRAVARSLSAIYVVVLLVVAGLAAMFSRGG